MDDMLTTDYDGCGRCLAGVRRLSRKTDKTSSPQRQGDQILQATADAGGHIIAWADDWEVSGATDPLTRRGFGPWLRGEMGPYDGIAAASVDRVGRNVRDTLNTQTLLTSQDRVVVTADHAGVWDFSDSNQENEWLAKAWGSQMELRAIQKRNRDETIRARNAGEPTATSAQSSSATGHPRWTASLPPSGPARPRCPLGPRDRLNLARLRCV
jgi:site-specific DNA recombinase